MIPELQEFQLRALARAQKIAVRPAAISEAVGTVLTVFGDKWLAEACGRDPAQALPLRRHPIGNLLQPPGDHQVLGFLELSEYLRYAARSPAFVDLVNGLKSSYGHAFLQLAFGFRFARAGAADIVFEPPVLGGLRGDIACTVYGRKIIAECYIPRLAGTHSDQADWLLTQCLNQRQGRHACVLSMAIKLKKRPSSVERKALVRILRELGLEIETNVSQGRSSDDARYLETDVAHISVARTAPVGPGQSSLGRQHDRFPDTEGREPSIFGRVGLAPAEALRNADVLEGGYPTSDHVAIWLCDEDREAQSLGQDLDEPLESLGHKLERKLAQTKVGPGTGRLLVVSSWITGQLHRAPERALARLKDQLFRRHAGVTGLLMVARRHRQEPPRHCYEIVPVLPEQGGALPRDFIDEMLRLESDHTIP